MFNIFTILYDHTTFNAFFSVLHRYDNNIYLYTCRTIFLYSETPFPCHQRVYKSPSIVCIYVYYISRAITVVIRTRIIVFRPIFLIRKTRLWKITNTYNDNNASPGRWPEERGETCYHTPSRGPSRPPEGKAVHVDADFLETSITYLPYTRYVEKR